MKQIAIVLLGSGGVGRALIRQIVRGRDTFARRNQCQFNVVAVTDSQGWVWQPTGLTDPQLLALVAHKEAGQRFAEARPPAPQMLETAYAAGLRDLILVDVTAEDGLEPTLNCALDLGYSAALANKKAFAGPWATAQRYFNNPRIRHESTVGGGQPVIATLRYLLDTQDAIHHIEGQMSGTLGFLCSQMDAGQRFSEALAEAKAKGYTEPDPREDLGGRDVLRKVMILGRMAGWPLEEGDFTVESLYPAEMAGLSVAEFMHAAADLDDDFRERVGNAAANGQILRFVGEVTPQGGSVGLKPLAQNSPQAGLKYISFQTDYYNDPPLLLAGKGAGVDMTAAGVLGDMIDLARELYGTVQAA
ncbi:MAG: homoserine dehydrogenase [Chloroflexi bacterium]|nr:homoserine dehydrogenase [Chloroflexota bacterium]